MRLMSEMPVKAWWLAGAGCVVFFVALWTSTHFSSTSSSALPSAYETPTLPLAFERNLGQADAVVDFISRGRGYTLFVTPGEAVLRVQGETVPVRLRWLDAAAAPVFYADKPLPGERHVYGGADRSAWRQHIPAYAQVRYTQVYAGIDLVYYGARGQLEYDWVISPGADPSLIRMEVAGVDELLIDESGALRLQMTERAVTLPKPVIYQNTSAGRRSIAGGYHLSDDRHVGFWLGDYDPTLPLVIDPVLVYSSYRGGAGADIASRVAVDDSGNVYLTGQTASADFPVTAGAQQNSRGGGSDAFVAKFDAAGALIYASYLGGAGTDRGVAVAADASGAAYVSGTTDSGDFPVVNPRQSSYAGNIDGFVAKLSADGASLMYATYLGGSAQEAMNAIAVDAGGAAYVAGGTLSTDFPVTAGAVQTSFASVPNEKNVVEADAFVSKISVDGGSLVFSSFLGGKDGESVFDIALAPGGELVVAGGTKSTNFPLTVPNVRGVFGGFPEDAFISRFNASGTSLSYSSFFGGDSWDSAYAVAVDTSGNMYLAGVTASSNMPATAATPQRQFGGGRSDGFVAKLSAAGDTVLYGTYLGGSDLDQINGIALAGDRSLVVVGESSSADFPLSQSLQSFLLGTQDGIIARLNPAGTVLDWSSYWGGGGDDRASAVVRTASKIYVAGTSASTDFPVLGGAQTQLGGETDAFLAGFDDGSQVADVSLTLRDREDPVALNSDVIYDITVGNNGPEPAAGVSVRSELPEGYSLISATSSQGTCSSAAAVLRCDVGTINVGGNAQVALTLRARQGGANALSATIERTLQSDPNVANNTAREETTVTVGNGGGSMTPPTLITLLLLLVARLRRAIY